MLQFDPGQLYFFGHEVSNRLHQATKLGMEGSHQALELVTKTVQFHADATARLMKQTSTVQDVASIKKLWSEVFELMRESVSYSNSLQKQAVDVALKTTEMFFANVFDQNAMAEPVSVGKSGK